MVWDCAELRRMRMEKYVKEENSGGPCLWEATVFLKTKERLEKRIAAEGKAPLRLDEPSFGGLLRMLGYARSEYAGDDPVLASPEAAYAELFSCREEVWELLTDECGMDSATAAAIAKRTRQGRYAFGRMDEETERLLRETGVPERRIEQMKRAVYLPSREDLILALAEELSQTCRERQPLSGSL